MRKRKRQSTFMLTHKRQKKVAHNNLYTHVRILLPSQLWLYFNWDSDIQSINQSVSQSVSQSVDRLTDNFLSTKRSSQETQRTENLPGKRTFKGQRSTFNRHASCSALGAFALLGDATAFRSSVRRKSVLAGDSLKQWQSSGHWKCSIWRAMQKNNKIGSILPVRCTNSCSLSWWGCNDINESKQTTKTDNSYKDRAMGHLHDTSTRMLWGKLLHSGIKSGTGPKLKPNPRRKRNVNLN